MDKRFISITELSQYLSVPVKTIRWWVWQRQIPHQKFGRLIRFDVREIEIWTKDRKVEVVN